MMRHRANWIVVVVLIAVTAGASSRARATWSIAIADCESREVAVGTVTCLNNFDLLAIVPVVIVGKGAAAVQAAGDFQGIRRPVIFDGFINGDSPEDIFALLERISGHQSRQYGIADTQCRMLTFTGSGASEWKGGVIGRQGSMVYAIQGNILAGGCVVPAIERAVLDTDGDVAEKLMAGMEAAQETGGDGRCSCSPNNPTGCGCPPDNDRKSGHIGGMIVARIGDMDDAVCNASGCADGDYFMRLNVPFQGSTRPDPVFQLRELFDAWRADLNGRPDAVQSRVTFDPPRIPPNGSATTTMTIELLDWRGEGITTFSQMTRLEHAEDSDGRSIIGSIVDQGNGVFTVELTAGTLPGVDRFVVTVDDGQRPVTLMPEPRFEYHELGDIDGDGVVGFEDYRLLAPCIAGPGATEPPDDCDPLDFVNSDLDGDGDADLGDFANLEARIG
jgi:uncharacterized Ntn-hydrolase superfamily protein